MRQPNFFIVGAPKCGTTALYSSLRRHPDVFLPDNKEPQYFGSDQHLTHRPRHTLDWYLAHYEKAENQKRIGDASTTYLHSTAAAHEIKAFAPEARIIVMLRPPVDVMYAYHSEHLVSGYENITDFGEALDAEEDRKRGARWPDRNGVLETLLYRRVASFPTQLQRYFDTFGRENVKVILNEDLRRNSDAVLHDVLGFLGIASDVPLPAETINSNRQIRHIGLHDFLFHPPPLARAAVSRLLPRSLRRKLVARVSKMNLSVAPRPGMDPQLRQRLVAEFAPQVEQLGAMLGRDLSHWNR